MAQRAKDPALSLLWLRSGSNPGQGTSACNRQSQKGGWRRGRGGEANLPLYLQFFPTLILAQHFTLKREFFLPRNVIPLKANIYKLSPRFRPTLSSNPRGSATPHLSILGHDSVPAGAVPWAHPKRWRRWWPPPPGDRARSGTQSCHFFTGPGWGWFVTDTSTLNRCPTVLGTLRSECGLIVK